MVYARNDGEWCCVTGSKQSELHIKRLRVLSLTMTWSQSVDTDGVLGAGNVLVNRFPAARLTTTTNTPVLNLVEQHVQTTQVTCGNSHPADHDRSVWEHGDRGSSRRPQSTCQTDRHRYSQTYTQATHMKRENRRPTDRTTDVYKYSSGYRTGHGC